MKIGFFDSGVGGVIILKAVRSVMPEYDYVFFGDTENVPYGGKSEEEIYELTKAGVLRLFNEGALLVVVACNTASSESLRRLQDTFLHVEHPNKKVLGVIIPTVEVLNVMDVKRPLLVATQRTVESRKFNIELHKIDKDLELHSIATPELVPLIESDLIADAFKSIRNSIDPIVGEIDAIVLGCTHYTVLKDKLRDTYNVPIISQDEIIPEKLKLYLERHPEVKSKLSIGGTVKILLSKESVHYDHVKEQLLQS
jgi:glutamate racemase